MFVAVALTQARLSATEIMPVGLQVPDTKEVVPEGLWIIAVLLEFARFSFYGSLAVEAG